MTTQELEEVATEDKKEISLSFSDCPFGVAMSTISSETGAAIVWSKEADSTTISGVYVGTEVNTLLLAVAKRNGLQLVDLGGIYLIGQASVSDLVSTVLRSPSSDNASVISAVQSCCSEFGKVTALGSQLIITDYLYNVKKTLEVVKKLRENSLRGYIAEVYFLRMKDSDLLGLQLELDATGVDVFSCAWNLQELFKATLDCQGESRQLRIDNRPILYLSEGRVATLDVGTDIVMSQSTVSEQGYSSVSGYETFADGVQLSLTPHRISTEVISLDVTLEVSKFTDDTRGGVVPQTQKSRLVTPGVLLTDGAVYFLGSLRLQEQSKGFGLFSLSGSRSDEIITVWVRLRELGVTNPVKKDF